MKKTISAILAFAMLLSSCGAEKSSDSKAASKSYSSEPVTENSENTNENAAEESAKNEEASESDTVKESIFSDPYATENVYHIDETMFEKREGVDYGTIIEDAEYFSTTADDYKQCNIQLPAGYDEKETYPVMYIIHGWGGSHSDQISEDSYLTILYSNMLAEGLCEPMILVNVDMYTDKQALKADTKEEKLRYAYDKVIDDIGTDVMPFIQENYPVKKGREYTAVAGMSQGGSESLATGFQWLDKIGWIGSFAPDPGVIPTEFYKGTYWNTPYFEAFPTPDETNTPYYLYLSVGTDDPWNVDVTRYYAEVLDDMGVQNQTDVVDGFEHGYIFWRICFYNFLTKAFR